MLKPFSKCSDDNEAQDFKAAEIFAILEEALRNEGKDLVKKIKGIFAFKVKGSQGNIVTWIVDVKNGSGKVELNGKGNSLSVKFIVLLDNSK